MGERADRSFFRDDILKVAPSLPGMVIVTDRGNGYFSRSVITEVEAYRGREDLACHASKGKTSRNAVMFLEGGYLYMYLIYGMYWMMNIVTGPENEPQAALIRGIDVCYGPGRLTRHLGLDRSFYGEDLVNSKRIWIEKGEPASEILCDPRIGINYAAEPWKSIPWRFHTRY